MKIKKIKLIFLMKIYKKYRCIFFLYRIVHSTRRKDRNQFFQKHILTLLKRTWRNFSEKYLFKR